MSRVIALLVLLLPGLTWAQIYRWTDAEGRVHFSQQPVAGATPVEVRPQVIERDQATREREAGAARFFEARREEQVQAQARAAEAREKASQQCARLRRQLDQLGSAHLFYRTDEQGKRHYYSDGEVAAARNRLQTTIRENCS